MNASTVKPLICGIFLAALGGGVWLSFEPANSEASTSPVAVGQGVEEPTNVPAEVANDVAPQTLDSDSAIAALDRAVSKVEGRFRSIQEASKLMNADAMKASTSFRRLTLAVEDGVVTTTMEEVVAPLSQHRRAMEVSAFNAKRLRDDAMEGVGWLRRGSESASSFDAAIGATIEIAILSELSRQGDSASRLRHQRRICELIEVVAPHFPPERAKRLARARKRCASLDD
jgi:hypothetical protein